MNIFRFVAGIMMVAYGSLMEILELNFGWKFIIGIVVWIIFLTLIDLSVSHTN